MPARVIVTVTRAIVTVTRAVVMITPLSSRLTRAVVTLTPSSGRLTRVICRAQPHRTGRFRQFTRQWIAGRDHSIEGPGHHRGPDEPHPGQEASHACPKAFRSEPVPRDPNDEPAAALLERLRPEPGSGHVRKGRRVAGKSAWSVSLFSSKVPPPTDPYPI